MATDHDTYYVRCAACGWTSYRSMNGRFTTRGKQLTSSKPCKECGRKTVRVVNTRGRGVRGPDPKPIKHGTRVGFKRGCRCKKCTKAERAYQRERYAERKAARR